jgi:hypothetical protein
VKPRGQGMPLLLEQGLGEVFLATHLPAQLICPAPPLADKQGMPRLRPARQVLAFSSSGALATFFKARMALS